MKVVLILGTMRRSSTYQVARDLMDRIARGEEHDILEFFLPKDMPHFCVGCFQCFLNSEEKCPHAPTVQPIARALETADIIILASPVYVFNVTGQMKTLLDHLGYQWLPHRPREAYFKKIGVAISTTAGSGTGPTLKTLVRNLRFWGTARQFSLGLSVQASHWDEVKPEIRKKIAHKNQRLADKILALKPGHQIRPSLMVRLEYYLFRFLHKKGFISEVDHLYWKEKGWLDKGRPF